MRETTGRTPVAREAPRMAAPRPEVLPPPDSPPRPVFRRDLGLRPLNALLPSLTRPAFRRRSPAAAHLMSDWPEIVGPILAAQTMPQRLAGGTLTLGCAGPVAMELQHLAPQLISKINGAMGQVVVERLRFVQIVMPAAPRRTPRPVPVALPETVDARIAGIDDPELRAVLERLGQGVYRQRR